MYADERRTKPGDKTRWVDDRSAFTGMIIIRMRVVDSWSFFACVSEIADLKQERAKYKRLYEVEVSHLPNDGTCCASLLTLP